MNCDACGGLFAQSILCEGQAVFICLPCLDLNLPDKALLAKIALRKARALPKMDPPRRCRLEHLTPAERAIRDAIEAVEYLGADTRLTEAVVLLGQARDKVAAFVDEE